MPNVVRPCCGRDIFGESSVNTSRTIMSCELTYRSKRTRPTVDRVTHALGAFLRHLFLVASTASTTVLPSHSPTGAPDNLERHKHIGRGIALLVVSLLAIYTTATQPTSGVSHAGNTTPRHTRVTRPRPRTGFG